MLILSYTYIYTVIEAHVYVDYDDVFILFLSLTVPKICPLEHSYVKSRHFENKRFSYYPVFHFTSSTYFEVNMTSSPAT